MPSNAPKMAFCFLIGKPSASHGRPATKQLVLQPIADALTLIVISVSCSPIKKLVVGTFLKTALKQYQEDPINCDVTAERLQYVTARFTIFVLKSFTTVPLFIMLQLEFWISSYLMEVEVGCRWSWTWAWRLGRRWRRRRMIRLARRWRCMRSSWGWSREWSWSGRGGDCGNGCGGSHGGGQGGGWQKRMMDKVVEDAYDVMWKDCRMW